MKNQTKVLYSDIAPAEGREEMTRWQTGPEYKGLTWEEVSFSLAGELKIEPRNEKRTLRLQGRMYPQDTSRPAVGWIELETITGHQTLSIADLYLVGTRPLPQSNITCVSRHPISKDYLVAATSDSCLLLLDARLQANLEVLLQLKLTSPLVSLVCSGKRLLGLGAHPDQSLHIFDIITNDEPMPHFSPGMELFLPRALVALAENDACSAWGLTAEGEVFYLPLPDSLPVTELHLPSNSTILKQASWFHHPQAIMTKLLCGIKAIYRAIRNKQPLWQLFSPGSTVFSGFAYDGRHFWTFSRKGQNIRVCTLRCYNQDGNLLRSYSAAREVSLSALSYLHNNLLVLDLEHLQLHQYHLADTMQPIAGLSPHNRHPGYLPAGSASTAGIHNLCLLYVGAEGRSSVHRYDIDKLQPLVAYINPAELVSDYFMDGFLLLAQHSPLLNGRSFGLDLKGKPARREDWIALFDEYFHPQSNLQALENCTAEVNHQLQLGKTRQVKVVLSIPTPDPRCSDWDNEGYSLAEDSQRIEVTEWAMQELICRWKNANFQHLTLAGFYYMTEQGTWNDQVLHMFPKLCDIYGLTSFSIPGITSSWITEFTRAGFDCVALQSSHSFWQPPHRPQRYLLKCAGRIAREFGMGMEIELPYDVMEPEGRQKLSDYLEMAYIQGWAGAFKAYFQSYNLIKVLAESKAPECRQLYDDLYHISLVSRQMKPNITYISNNKIPIEHCFQFPMEESEGGFRLNIEGHRGIFRLTGLSEE